MNKKVLIAIADGVGDLPIIELGNLTPLEYAKTPTLDKLAAEGASGIIDILRPGVPVGTDMGHMMLLGFNEEDYPGRGPLEAAGIGLEVLAGDVVFRCNFATVDETGLVLDRRAGRIRDRTDEIAESLNNIVVDRVKVIFHEATEHRAVLILRGENLSANITDTDPKLPDRGLSYELSAPLDYTEAARNTSYILNKVLQKFHDILKDHPVNRERIENGEFPANFILTRGSGQVPNIQKITEKLGFKGVCIASESTVLGVSNLAGYQLISKEGMTGNLDTDVKLKADLAVEALKTNDIVLLHFKATDLMGHDNNPKGKVAAIEKFDEMLSYVVENRPENTLIAFTADHSTPCERKEHSGDPVPLVINGPSIRVDRNDNCNEIDCAYGGIGRIRGQDFANIIFDYLELSEKKGN